MKPPFLFTKHQSVVKLCSRLFKENNFYDASTTAKMLAVSENTLHKLTVLGKIPHVIIKLKFYYARPDVEAFKRLYQESLGELRSREVDYWVYAQDACDILNVNHNDLIELTDLGLISCVYIYDGKRLYREDELYDFLSKTDPIIDQTIEA